MKKRRAERTASAPALDTLGEWLAHAEKLYALEKVALGQVATNAHDEALYLLLRTLDLPLDSEAAVLKKKLSAAERRRIEEALKRRGFGRGPAADFTPETVLGGAPRSLRRRGLHPPR